MYSIAKCNLQNPLPGTQLDDSLTESLNLIRWNLYLNEPIRKNELDATVLAHNQTKFPFLLFIRLQDGGKEGIN